MSIGEVLAQLRAEFPDTTISKLRFLEAEGLVEPQRTASGYRKYSWDDVARLRFVLTAQRDQYLPLRVIREQLAALGRRATGAGRPALVAVGPPRARAAPAEPADEVRLSRAELVDAQRDRRGRPGRAGAAWAGRARGPTGGTTATRSSWRPRWPGWPRTGWSCATCAPYRAAADREVGLFAQLLGAAGAAERPGGAGPGGRGRAGADRAAAAPARGAWCGPGCATCSGGDRRRSEGCRRLLWVPVRCRRRERDGALSARVTC